MKFGYTDLSRDMEPLELGWKHLLLVLWREIFTLIKANVWFIIFCIPCVTIPAALIAIHSICIDVIRGKQVKVASTYWNTLRTMFLPSISAFAVLSIMAAFGIYGAIFYYQWSLDFKELLFLMLLPSSIAVIALLMCPYCFSMLACTSLPLRQILKNSFLLVFLNLKFNICGGVIIVALTVWQLYVCLQAIPLIMTCGIAVMVYIAVYFTLFGIQTFVLTDSL